MLTGAQAEIEKTEYGDAGAWQINKFYAKKLTINEGDTVIWKLNSVEMHNIIFPPPGQSFVPYITPQGNDAVVSSLSVASVGGPTYNGTGPATSGQLSMEAPGVQQYKLNFSKAGTYTYFCSIHSAQLPNGQVVGMVGSITVQAAGSTLSKSSDQVSAENQAEISADQAAASSADAQAEQVAPPDAGPNGTMTYHANVGYDTQDAAYMRFAPQDFTIHVGDKVMWQQTSAFTPHTITFPSGGPEPDIANVQPQPGGPPRVTLNPKVLAPSGGSTYAGRGFYNSGFISGTQDPAPGPRTYNLTFTKPGTYEYICILHDKMGMVGHVTVLAAGTTPGMPATGQSHSEDGILTLAAGLSALALLFAGLLLRRKLESAA